MRAGQVLRASRVGVRRAFLPGIACDTHQRQAFSLVQLVNIRRDLRRMGAFLAISVFTARGSRTAITLPGFGHVLLSCALENCCGGGEVYELDKWRAHLQLTTLNALSRLGIIITSVAHS